MNDLCDVYARILLDRKAAWLLEFAGALSRQAGIVAYSARTQVLGRFSTRLSNGEFSESALKVIEFPVQRGYFSFPLWNLLGEHGRIAAWIQSETPDSTSTWLICCYPHYCRVAELWAGPVVYYATDLFSKYDGRSYRNVAGMEKALCRRASLVCPNSRRIADYLVGDCACPPEKILVLPNAVREGSLLPGPATAPLELPAAVAGLPRPVAGIIGNMGANVDWVLLEQVVERTPWLSWLFVGPTSASISDRSHSLARTRLLRAGGRVRFVGPIPYSELKTYARGFDVAVLPYSKREPTYSGSSTRFYEHLAACRPILATDGVEELLHKEPLLRILRAPAQWIRALEALRDGQFQDGVEALRWQQSQKETLGVRAKCLRDAMAARQSSAAGVSLEVVR